MTCHWDSPDDCRFYRILRGWPKRACAECKGDTLMTREEHNNHFGVNRDPEEHVLCNTGGYGELSQYDPLCCACWLGHPHTWAEHDSSVTRGRKAADDRLTALGVRKGGYVPQRPASVLDAASARVGRSLPTTQVDLNWDALGILSR